MTDDARLCVAVDVGLPLPARCVGVTRTDVFGLQALKFLLRAELVGLDKENFALIHLQKQPAIKRGRIAKHTIVIELHGATVYWR